MRYIFFLPIMIIINMAQYAPLNNGNIWVYENIGGRNLKSVKTEITIDTLKYFLIDEDSVRLRNDGFYVVKRSHDFPMDNNEQIYYKENAELGDSWTTSFSNGQTGTTTVVHTQLDMVYGQQVILNFIEVDFGIVWRNEIWTDEFGLLLEGDKFDIFRIQTGCVIDGIVYGDTSLVTSVEDVDMPNEFNLHQNYPNPFNPSTTIKFTIPNVGAAFHASRNTKLVVYDILGREIKTLLNKQMQPGNYEVTFDGSNLTSGVYFYVLETEGKRLSKKMLLLK